jgi:hypothetical protein
MDDKSHSARCPSCHGLVPVEDRDTHGDQIICRNCDTGLKVLRRGAGIRLVFADLGPLRDQLRESQQQIKNLEAELARARASFGIGSLGIGLGVIYVLARVALENEALTQELIRNGVLIAIGVGVLLELANYFFLAKRSAMTRLSGETADAKKEARRLKQLIREAQRA